ncbi:MAG: ChbG/HpnK family deacetylase [Lactimicrobium sp.]|jgi:predicted glycoside hydrolase/deacetylase ChbG (UPF0249 family)|uniref:ChbG/HpnK family deacetylase n=1 Tax=Lactimicrobium sp. TaxID=2563780 RepID=UPI002F356A6C
MKLIAQSDDYGITPGCAAGALAGIRHGIIRNTGLFANMPWAKECVDEIRPYLSDIAFGIDLNASTGPSLLGHDAVPALTHEDDSFYGSRENRAMDNDENGHDHLSGAADQLEAEFNAQIQMYIKLVGHVPDYVHNHAYATATTMAVSKKLAAKYHCIWTDSVMKKENVANAGMGWYRYGGPEEQLKEDMISYLVEDKGGMLASGKLYGYLVCHCGYADAPIFALSSFNTCRVKDLEAVTSSEILKWVKDHGIELITFRDLPRDWEEK